MGALRTMGIFGATDPPAAPIGTIGASSLGMPVIESAGVVIVNSLHEKSYVVLTGVCDLIRDPFCCERKHSPSMVVPPCC